MQTFIYFLETAHPCTTKHWHKHTTLSLHRRCERTLHFLALVHWWPWRTLNSRCYQQLGPHNTKHGHTNQSANHYTIQPDIVDNSTCTIIWPPTHHHHNQHTTWLYNATKPRNIYKLQDNIIFTNIILMADKHNIPNGKMHSNCRLLPDHIVCNITQGNNIRSANTCHPALKLLNKEITSDIHNQNLWKEHLDTPWDHRHNTHILRKTIHGPSNRIPPPTLTLP